MTRKVNILIIAVLLMGVNAAARDFGFASKQVLEFKEGLSRLSVADLNGDGRGDIIFVNNAAARIEILMRDDGASGGDGFRNLGFVTDQRIAHLETADLNGDGKLDIIAAGAPVGLQIYLRQDGDGVKFAEPLNPYIEGGIGFIGLRVADVDDDGDLEILACRRNSVVIVAKNNDGLFRQKKIIPLAASRCAAFMTGDFNADHKIDMVYLAGKSSLPLRFKPGLGDGDFGWEEPMTAPPLEFIDDMNWTPDRSYLGVILKNGSVFRVLRVEAGGDVPVGGLDEVVPATIPVEGLDGKTVPAALTADINADGYADLCLAAPELNAIDIFYGSGSGFSAQPEIVESLRGVADIAALNGDMIVFSPKEKLVARHRRGELEEFPQILKTTFETAAMTCRDGSIYLYAREPKTNDADDAGNYHILKGAWPDEDGFKPSEEWEIPSKNNCDHVRIVRLDQDGEAAILFTKYHRPKMYKLGANSVVDEITPAEWGALANSSMSVGNVVIVGDGSLVAAERKLARLYHWRGDGFEIVRQFNPNEKSADITAAALGDGARELMLFDQSNNNLLRFDLKVRDKESKTHLDGNDSQSQMPVPFKGDDNSGVFLVNPKRLSLLPDERNGSKVSKLYEYSSENEDPRLWFYRQVALGDMKTPMVAIVDRANRGVEILAEINGELVHQVAFEIFQDSGFGGGTSSEFEPHDLASGDINGDGIGDLAILVHDKLVIHYGE